MRARREGRGGARVRDPARRLLVWRGVTLVAVGGAGLAGLGIAWTIGRGDRVTAALFSLSLLALLGLLVLALRRVKALLGPDR